MHKKLKFVGKKCLLFENVLFYVFWCISMYFHPDGLVFYEKKENKKEEKKFMLEKSKTGKVTRKF